MQIIEGYCVICGGITFDGRPIELIAQDDWAGIKIDGEVLLASNHDGAMEDATLLFNFLAKEPSSHEH